MKLEDLNVLDETDYEEPIANLPFDLGMLQNFFSSFPSNIDKFTMSKC